MRPVGDVIGSASAVTPTYTYPPCMSSLCPKTQPTSRSRPVVAFIHSTTTVPLKRRLLTGRRTIIRVLYGADELGVTVHFPSDPSVPTGEYASAVPDTKYSRSV